MFPKDIPVQKSALLSDCGKYRYSLERIWEPLKPVCTFVGLNPSTADAFEDDPTIRRCMSYAYYWGYGSMVMLNLFAYRATVPKDMMGAEDPVGPDNIELIRKYILNGNAGCVIAAWGKDGRYLGQDKVFRDLFPNLHYLKLNKDGSPGHPLYLKSDLLPQLWEDFNREL